MQLDKALSLFSDSLKHFTGTYMSQLSDQITALQTQVTTTAAKVSSDLANLQTQLNTLTANQANQFTASDLANLQSIQTQIAGIDAATPAPAPASTPAAPVNLPGSGLESALPPAPTS